MPPKPASNSAAPKLPAVSVAVKAAAAAVSGNKGGIGSAAGGGASRPAAAPKDPPKKKKTVAKVKRPSSVVGGGGGGSPAVIIGKNDTLIPKGAKMAVVKSNSAAASSAGSGASSAVDKIKFSSQYGGAGVGGASSPEKKATGATASGKAGVGKSGAGTSGGNNSKLPSSSGGGGGTSTAASIMQQAKLERAQTAKRELAEMDAIERAFLEDVNVWTGPANVAFPRRYYANSNNVENEEAGKKKESSISNPYMSVHASQSRGWMYGEGYAGIGGKSWIDVTTHSAANKKKKNIKKDESDATSNDSDGVNKSFLMDDVAIIDNALKANGLTRADVTPKAYACLLEQARRYALELLADAQDYAVHAQRNSIPSLAPADLMLAAEMRDDGGGGRSVHGVASTLPSPEDVANVASEVNRIPLPPIPSNCYNGVALPPVERQLTARTYDVVNGARVAQRMMRGGDLPLNVAKLGSSTTTAKRKTTGGGGPGANSKGGDEMDGSSTKRKKKVVGPYGAGRGRQISVHIKSKKN